MTTNHHCQAGGKKHSTKKKSRHVKNKTKSKKKTFRKTRKSMKGGARRGASGMEDLLLPFAPILVPAALTVGAAGAVGYGGYRLTKATRKAVLKWRMGQLDKKKKNALVNALKELQKKAQSLSSDSVVEETFNEWEKADKTPEEYKKDVKLLLTNLLNSSNSSNSSNLKTQNKTNKNKPLPE